MQKLTPKILNKQNEIIDTWIEFDGGKSIKANVVMVHGFGTDKHETAGYFNDISMSLVSHNYRVVRFDLTGYGLSGGKQSEACYSKHVGDLNAIIKYVASNYAEPMYIFAQSMGCFVTALTKPDKVEKTIMTGLPNANTQIIIDRISARFGSRPGSLLNFDGISLLPRSTGKIQEIGSNFWRDIYALEPVKIIREYSQKTNLLVINWNQDEILGSESLEQYDDISSLKHIWLDGNHSVTDPTDRQNFINVMLDFFQK